MSIKRNFLNMLVILLLSKETRALGKELYDKQIFAEVRVSETGWSIKRIL